MMPMWNDVLAECPGDPEAMAKLQRIGRAVMKAAHTAHQKGLISLEAAKWALTPWHQLSCEPLMQSDR
jgi:hypothetical protein